MGKEEEAGEGRRVPRGQISRGCRGICFLSCFRPSSATLSRFFFRRGNGPSPFSSGRRCIGRPRRTSDIRRREKEREKEREGARKDEDRTKGAGRGATTGRGRQGGRIVWQEQEEREARKNVLNRRLELFLR